MTDAVSRTGATERRIQLVGEKTTFDWFNREYCGGKARLNSGLVRYRKSLVSERLSLFPRSLVSGERLGSNVKFVVFNTGFQELPPLSASSVLEWEVLLLTGCELHATWTVLLTLLSGTRTADPILFLL